MKAMAVGEGSALGTYEPGTRQEETALRGYLSGFGLNAYKAVIPVKHLSGGQRMRVAMVRHNMKYMSVRIKYDCILTFLVCTFELTLIGGGSCAQA